MQTKLFKQLNSKNNALKSVTYRYRRPSIAQEFNSEIYPFGNDYFHELNPVLSLNLLELDQLAPYQAVTLKDGPLLFADFILKNIAQISTLKTKFYVQEELAPLIPDHLKNQFGLWKITQNSPLNNSYKNLLITGIISDFTMDLKKLEENLKKLMKYNFETISIFLPTRKSPFDYPWLENYITNETIELIKSYYPNKKILNIKTKDLLETTSWKETLLLDTLQEAGIISDNYANFEILGRGGDVFHINNNRLKDMELSLDISFYHQIQYSPLKEYQSVFTELLFLKKKSKNKTIFLDPEIVDFIKRIKP